jgi:hypothetical protein
MFFDSTLKICLVCDEITKVNLIKIGDSIYKKFIIVIIPSNLFFSEDTIEKILINLCFIKKM